MHAQLPSAAMLASERPKEEAILAGYSSWRTPEAADQTVSTTCPCLSGAGHWPARGIFDAVGCSVVPMCTVQSANSLRQEYIGELQIDRDKPG